jgi:uncharacterized protein YdaU (DUF1376 family)
MNYYPFHIGDYISHTSHLTDAEDLAYRRMIDLYYQSEQPFTDVEFVARRVKSTPEIVSVLLSDFFVKTEDGWRNKRADEEIEKYHAKAESARNANKAKLEKKSALKSELKSEPKQDATNNQEPITNNHSIEVAKAPKAKRLSLEELPKEWEDFCKKERPDLKPQYIWNQFRDYWIAQGGQKGAKLDWFATWRNWVRNQKSQAIGTVDKPTIQWHQTLGGVMAKGKELGIEPRAGETEGQYRQRLMSAGA